MPSGILLGTLPKCCFSAVGIAAALCSMAVVAWQRRKVPPAYRQQMRNAEAFGKLLGWGFLVWLAACTYGFAASQDWLPKSEGRLALEVTQAACRQADGWLGPSENGEFEGNGFFAKLKRDFGSLCRPSVNRAERVEMPAQKSRCCISNAVCRQAVIRLRPTVNSVRKAAVWPAIIWPKPGSPLPTMLRRRITIGRFCSWRKQGIESVRLSTSKRPSENLKTGFSDGLSTYCGLCRFQTASVRSSSQSRAAPSTSGSSFSRTSAW